MNQAENLEKRGRLFVVSAPSGTGKTTLCDALRANLSELCYSISYTTRKPRKGEVEGRDYHFLSEKEFKEGIELGRWAEWANVHGNFYASSAFVLEETLRSGRSLLLEIDVQGMRKIVERFPEAVTIFILPPSMEILKQRLIGRNTDAAEVVERRMKDALLEMQRKDSYMYRIVNDDFNKAKDALITLVAACINGEDPELRDY